MARAALALAGLALLTWPRQADAEGLTQTLSARLMTGYEMDLEKPSEAQGGERSEESGFFLHQARLRLDADLDERFALALSGDLADGANPRRSPFDWGRPQYLRDAFVEARFPLGVRLRAGHFKRPFSRLALDSAAELPFRGRGLLDAVLMQNGRWGARALGATLWGRLERARLTWSLAAMNPNFSPAFREQGYDALARLEWEPWRWLTLGANGGRKSVELEAGEASGHAVGADMRFTFGDFSARLEGSHGDLVFETAGVAAFGGHATLTWDFEVTPVVVLQPVLFVEYADASSESPESEAVRLLGGVNVLHHDTFRVMPQVALTRPVGEAGEDNPWAERTQYYLMLALDL